MRKLHLIARDIIDDWNPVGASARPYVVAMASLDYLDDMYGADDAESIVMYFLANSGRWQGPVAREIKKELRGMLKGRRGSCSPSRVASAWLKKEVSCGLE